MPKFASATLTLEQLLATPYPPKAVLLAPWMTKRHATMLWAPAGLGKTFASLSIALAVAGGGEFLGWRAPEARKVLVIDGEMDMEDLQDRCRLLLPAIGGDPAAAGRNLILYARQHQDPRRPFPDLADPDGRHAVFNMVLSEKPALLILDNWSTLAAVEDENAAEAFNPVMDLILRCKKAGTAVLLVHHARKDGEAYRGSSKMEATFNSVIGLKTPSGIRDTANAHFEWRWYKSRAVRDDSMRNLEVRLKDGQWSAEALQGDRLAEVVKLVKTCMYPSQKSLAKAMKTDQPTISRLKRQAIMEGLIKERDWDEALKVARTGGTGPEELEEGQPGAGDF